jgi:hypothetical protein
MRRKSGIGFKGSMGGAKTKRSYLKELWDTG